MRTLWGAAGAMVLAGAIGVQPALALEPLAGYDGFTARLISPAKWFGYEDNKRQSLAESIRVVAPNRTLGNRLRLMVRGYGRTDKIIGTSGGANRLRFYNADAVTAIRAKIWVNGYAVTGAGLNPDPGSVRARIAGFFFNVGTPVAGSAVGDVFAQAYVRRESDYTIPVDQLKVRASAVQCTNADCSTATVLGAADFGTVGRGQAVRLLLRWDRANHAFIVQRDALAPVTIAYTVADTSPPSVTGNKRLEVEYDAPDSTALPRAAAFIDAYFDEVLVNRSAAIAAN